MSLESFNFIDSLNASNPTTTDNVSEGDDHIRGIKTTLKNTFPNINAAVTATDEELNYVDGVTSNIQTQLGTKLPLAGGTMTGTIAGFTSTGIDDNATSTAITIDASENVLIGQTTSNFATTGIRLRASAGQMTATRSGGAPLAVNRLTSDGAILDFNSAGTNVGSVSVTGTGTTYSTGSTGGIDFSATSDGSGTMTSEVLDDYEEGTWTPTLLGGGGSVSSYAYQVGSYEKIGRQVTLRGHVSSAANTLTGAINIGGLPYTPEGTTNNHSTMDITLASGLVITAGISLAGHLVPANSTARINQWSLASGTNNADGSQFSNTATLVFSITYSVA